MFPNLNIEIDETIHCDNYNTFVETFNALYQLNHSNFCFIHQDAKLLVYGVVVITDNKTYWLTVRAAEIKKAIEAGIIKENPFQQYQEALSKYRKAEQETLDKLKV